MADIVTFPCEYLVVESGYTARLLERTKELEEFCSKNGVIPLFIKDPAWENGRTTPFVINDGIIHPQAEPTSDAVATCDAIVEKLTANGLRTGDIIVFRVGNFSNATNVLITIQGLNYCSMYNIDDVKFLRNDEGAINITYVSVDSD